ncbi:MAG TPA: hypothetical protein VFY73_05870 [Ideonella sp.]|uniref:hypothetical protein n=1 Tax=Ideonella sp. TaxID=1929293 RepID=UPI002E3416E0|nr:hypothetical protein [Ideonella sp.]HEX5683548.1 hypothetical protein [Ideonella sp.]
MNRTLRPAARAIAALLNVGLATPAFACSDVTFSFQNTTGSRILVNQVTLINGTTGVVTVLPVLKQCLSGYTCATSAANLAPVAVGNAITGVQFQYQLWTFAGWGPNNLTAWYSPAIPQCVFHRDYGTWPI